ncbi:hypothetical protein BJY01DRAFT_210469 [Aspergillus pseudoustus]|uniref:Uncharacterized protein n=1 Tax=Aspergillus pseudoustus TaxID=1810923 RepID=A0ABR4KDY8_9EURO
MNEQADAGLPVFWNDILAYDPALHDPERLLEYPLFTGTNYLLDSTGHSSSSDSGFGNSTYSTLSPQYVSVPKGHMDHLTGLGNTLTSPETRVPVRIGFSHPSNTELPSPGGGQPGNADYETSFAAGEESGNGGNGDNNGGESEQNNNDMDDGHRQNNETHQNDQNDENDQMDDVFQELADDERIRPLTEAAENSFRTFNSTRNEATQELEDCTEEALTLEQNADTGRKKTITELYKSFKDDDQRKTKEALLQKLEEANRTIIRPTKYAGLEDARQALTRKHIDVDAANDPTIPRTDIEKQTIVAELVKAMESCARAQDNKANLDAWREKCKELPDIVELRCWQILEDQIKVHTEGQLSCFPSLTVQLDFETQKDGEPKPKPGRQFADRLACIFQTLRLWKSLCKAMLDPSRLEKFVHNPAGVEKSSSTNKKTNKKRGDHLKDYRKLKQERAASETSPSVQRPEGVPSLSSTQNRNDYTPVINYNNQLSAGLHQPNQQPRLDITQDPLSPSCHTLSPLPASLYTNGPPARTDTPKSCVKPKLTSIPKKRRTKASPLPAEPGVPFGIKSPKDMQQAQKGAVGRPRKRQRTQNDDSNDSNASNTTNPPRFTPPSDGTN